jgi:hypothetical protein
VLVPEVAVTILGEENPFLYAPSTAMGPEQTPSADCRSSAKTSDPSLWEALFPFTVSTTW